jgi:hypothetical protein
MATFKIDFIFNQGSGGFSESWYLTTNDHTSAFQAVDTVSRERALCLANSVIWEAVRVSDTDVLGDSLVSADYDSIPTTALPGDVNAVGALIITNATALYRRPFILRGMPDNFVQRDAATDELVLTGPAFDAINDYMDALIASHFQLRVRPKTGVNSVYKPVVTVAKNVTNPDYTTLTVPGLGGTILQADRIQLTGFRRTARALNGIFTAQEADVDGLFNINLNYVGRLSHVSASDLVKGKARKLIYEYKDVDDYEATTPRTRKSGRAFFVPAGRSRNRA